jgi:hypothetical protein
MDSKARIHKHLDAAAAELLRFIKTAEKSHSDRWVPAADIKRKLELNFVAVPRANKVQRGVKGWLFGILARKLEDDGLLDYKKQSNNRAFYRTR